MATENIVSKVYRVLTDVSSRVWDRVSFWCLAKDVELTNGKNLETTCGSITGITSSLTSTSTTMAASASAIKQLNDKIADLNSNLIPISTVQVSNNNTTSYGSEVENYVQTTSYTYTIQNTGVLRITLPINDHGSIAVKIGTDTYSAKSERTLIIGIVKKGDTVEIVNNTNGWYGVGVYVYY